MRLVSGKAKFDKPAQVFSDYQYIIDIIKDGQATFIK